MAELSVKQLIEQRYANLKTEHRKPGMEYVQGQEIREALLQVAPDRQDLIDLTDKDLMDEYTKWYMACKAVKNSDSEMSLPDML